MGKNGKKKKEGSEGSLRKDTKYAQYIIIYQFLRFIHGVWFLNFWFLIFHLRISQILKAL